MASLLHLNKAVPFLDIVFFKKFRITEVLYRLIVATGHLGVIKSLFITKGTRRILIEDAFSHCCTFFLCEQT